MNGAQALFKALIDAGLDTCFANPGTSEMQLVHEIGLTEGVRPILCLQENTVTGAADGYARMSGKPAFTMLHVGSGFANGIANLHNAGRANSPMVNVIGSNATYHQHNYPEHELINGRVADLARPVSHWTVEAKSAHELGVLAARAASYSRLGAGKICSIVAPTNCQWDEAVAPPAGVTEYATPHVPAETIAQIAALLCNGKKTALLLGSHALFGEGLELAGRIAAKTGADLLGETFAPRVSRGEGTVPLRFIPYLIQQCAMMLQPYQQVVLVGALPPATTFAYKGAGLLKLPDTCAQSTLATVDHDIVAALRDLAKAVDAPAEPAARRKLVAGAPPKGPLNADAIGQSLAIQMPANSILVNEGITLGLGISFRTENARTHDYLDSSAGGSIGSGMPVGLGAAIACPDRKTIVLQGDGSGLYTTQALWTMAREKANVIVVVLKNDNYAVLEVELARVRIGDANDKMLSMMHLTNPTIDWVQMAGAHGVPAVRATTAEEFHAALEKALAAQGPCVIEAQVADTVQPFVAMVRMGK